MSDAILVPDAVVDPPPVDPAATPTDIPISTPGQPANWRESLSPDLRENPTLANLDSVEALAKEHINVQKLIGGEKLARPQEDWTPEQFDDFYTQLGRPAKVEDYNLDGVERPEGVDWDDGFQSHMLGILHKGGASNDLVRQVLAGYGEYVGSAVSADNVDKAQTRESQIQDLRSEWGKSFDAQVDLAKRALRAGAGEGFEELADLEMAGGGKLGDNPAVIKAFATLGGKMNEHGLVGGTSSVRTTLSPQEAGAQRNKLMADETFLEAYLNAEHLEHGAAVKRMTALTEMAVAEV